jgi:hypothetical protein
MYAYHPGAPDVTLWVDPGESTGWAAWLDPPTLADEGAMLRYFQVLGFTEPPRFFGGQAPWRVVCEDLYALTCQFGSFLSLGWEDYLLLPGSRHHDPSALKVIGFLEWLTSRGGESSRPHTLVPQPSSNRLLGASKLTMLGWFRPGERDSNSAAAHLLSHLLSQNRLPAELLARVLPGEEASSGGC